MSAHCSPSVRVEIVAAEGTYWIHLPTRKPGDVQKYHPRPGELIAVCVNPAKKKLVGVPLRPYAEPLFARHFVRFLDPFSHHPWVVAVNGTDIERLVRIRFAAMCMRAHREWSCVLKRTPNMLNDHIARGFIELQRRGSDTMFVVQLTTVSPGRAPFSAPQPHLSTTAASSLSSHLPKPQQDQPHIPASYSMWANNLFRFKASSSVTSSVMSTDTVELNRSTGSTFSDAEVPPLTSSSPPADQTEATLPTMQPCTSVRAAFDRMLSPTTAWWNGLRP